MGRTEIFRMADEVRFQKFAHDGNLRFEILTGANVTSRPDQTGLLWAISVHIIDHKAGPQLHQLFSDAVFRDKAAGLEGVALKFSRMLDAGEIAGFQW